MSEHILEREQRQARRMPSRPPGLSASALMSILSTAELEAFEGLQPPSAGERPEFIKRIEPLWGKGSLGEERFIGAWMASDERFKDCSPGRADGEAGAASGDL